MERKTPLTQLQEVAYSVDVRGVNPKVVQALYTYIGGLEAALYMLASQDEVDREAVKDWLGEQELSIGLRIARAKRGML